MSGAASSRSFRLLTGAIDITRRVAGVPSRLTTRDVQILALAEQEAARIADDPARTPYEDFRVCGYRHIMQHCPVLKSREA